MSHYAYPELKYSHHAPLSSSSSLAALALVVVVPLEAMVPYISSLLEASSRDVEPSLYSPPLRRHRRRRHLSLTTPTPSRPLPYYESSQSHHSNVWQRHFLFPSIEACIDPNISSRAPLSLPDKFSLLSLSVLRHLRRSTLRATRGG